MYCEMQKQMADNFERSCRIANMMSQLKEITPGTEDMPEEWQDYLPELSIPELATYKVYNDGSHFVAYRYSENTGRKVKRTAKSDDEIAMASVFDVNLQCFLQDGLKGTALKNRMFVVMEDAFPTVKNVRKFVEKRLKSKWSNLYQRKKRFRRKAYLNKWNYFVTFTYDDEKHDETSFRTKLRKCLSNLATRRKWRYMGVFERAPETGRLHFHALMYIPKGEMVGVIEQREDYSTAQHKMQQFVCNTFFEMQFGRNDFEELEEMELRKGSTIEYLLKYIGKSNERIVTSRGIKGELETTLHVKQIACEMPGDFVDKYILFDNIIDWERDVMKFGYEQYTLF